jgi:phage anti-repressor protein
MDLMIKNEYEGVEVVTVDLIAQKHNKEKKYIKKQFRANIDFFEENKDYFVIKRTDPQGSYDELRDLFGSNAEREAYLFTRTGWLLLTKPMEDKQSWATWKEVINKFFEYEDKYSLLKQQYDSLKATVLRKDAALSFLPMKEAIENNIALSEIQKQWGARNYSILICKGLTGLTPAVYKKKYKTHGLEWRDHIKKVFPELLKAVTNTEVYIAHLQESQLSYKEAKPIIDKYMLSQLDKVRQEVKKIDSI